MAALGPYPADRRVAVAVSGGADSLALALLAAGWGQPRALIVDHRLRPGSGAEAETAAARLAARGIAARVLRLGGLAPGPALPERARRARYAALGAACREAGLAHLLVGHHAGDQAETVLMRKRRGSGARGLAGMGAVSAHLDLCILRPLLGAAPARLRATLRAASLAWAEDPTNTDHHFLRPRLRAELAASDPAPLLAAAADAGGARAAEDAAIAATIAACAAVHPAGFALLPPGPIAPAALATLIQAVSGTAYPPRADAVAACGAAPRAMTLGGARLLPAGRLGPGWLLIREAAAMAPPVAAARGAVWDGRFALASNSSPPPCSMIGALGPAAAGLRRASPLPAAVLATLPALWQGERLITVPHLLWPDPAACAGVAFGWQPARPAAAGAFLPPNRGCGTLMHALC